MTVQKPFKFVFRMVVPALGFILMAAIAPAAPESAPKDEAKAKEESTATAEPKPSKNGAKKETPVPKPEKTPVPKPEATPESAPEAAAEIDPDDAVAAENADAEQAAVARPVSPDQVQIYGWREYILISGLKEKLKAKLDTGAHTSSIHAEEIELFERDGKKWVRFIVTDPSMKKPARTRIEAPFVRIAKVKEPGSESVAREVVRLSFRIGDRKLRGEFTLNNRKNMLAPVLLGRNMIKDLGWVDAGRTHLADQKIFR